VFAGCVFEEVALAHFGAGYEGAWLRLWVGAWTLVQSLELS
jgi:hypothetical protein